MNIILTTFAAEQASGLGALGLNVQSFLFQLITFVIVLALLRKFVYQRLVDTLEARRTSVLESLDDAKKAAEDLKDTEAKTAAMLKQARVEADGILAIAHKEATAAVEEADAKAQKRADHIIETAEARMGQDIEKARKDLRAETMQLVALATEKIVKQKVDASKDAELIASALKETK